MGAWEELDTEIEVTVETDDIDTVLNMDDEFGVFEPVQEYLKNVKRGFEEGGKEGALDVARRNKSFQQQFIFRNCDNPSGMLATSIEYEGSDYNYLIGTRINHIYPMSVEYGRKGFGPIPPTKALAFYYQGELIFRKRVGPAKPRPFVAPAYEVTGQIADEIVLRKINIAIARYSD